MVKPLLALFSFCVVSASVVSGDASRDAVRSFPADGHAEAETDQHLGTGAVIFYDPKSCAWAIKGLLRNSPAEKAGLHKGDHLLAMDGVVMFRPKKVRGETVTECAPESALPDWDRLSEALAKSGRGARIELIVERSGTYWSFEAELRTISEIKAAEFSQ